MKIQNDVATIQAKIRNNPGYQPRQHEAPHIVKLVRAAVRYVNHTTGEQLPTFFNYRGRRYRLSFTNLGRVIVRDEDGHDLGSSDYFAVD